VFTLSALAGPALTSRVGVERLLCCLLGFMARASRNAEPKQR
jgi:hypothetical protein